MALEVITREDLNDFRFQLLEDLKEIVQSSTPQKKSWLKGTEVRKMLNISPGTLQNLRTNGSLPFTRMGGIIYYNSKGIDAILEKNMVHGFQNQRP